MPLHSASGLVWDRIANIREQLQPPWYALTQLTTDKEQPTIPLNADTIATLL